MAFIQILKRSATTLHSSIHSSISLLISSAETVNHNSPPLHLHPRNFCNKTIETPDAFNPQITTEADKLCKIISNHRDRSQLESSLNSTQITLSPALVTQVLKNLSNAGVFALSFFRWAEKQNGFKHTSESYNALIEALGKIKQFKIIWTLVNDMKTKGVLDKTTFALISRRYARAKKVDEAIEAFERMEKFGFKHELCDLNRFLDTLCKSRIEAHTYPILMGSFNKLGRGQKPITTNRMRVQFEHQFLRGNLGVNKLDLKIVVNGDGGIRRGRYGVQVNPFADGFVRKRLFEGHSFLGATSLLVVVVLLIVVATVGTHRLD